MDSILKSFSLAFLLRGLFSGVFFEISYYLAVHGTDTLRDGRIPTVTSSMMFVALFVGVISYGFHRAVIFPWIELFINSEFAVELRRLIPLISKRTIRMLCMRWGYIHCEAVPLISINSRIDAWADYTHLQYVSTICIALGAIAGTIISPIKPSPSCGIIAFSVFLWSCAFTSHWRQMALIDSITDKKAEPDARANGTACHDPC